MVGDTGLNIEGYHWIGHNRVNLHVRARTGSGGVGFLIKDTLLDSFNVTVLDRDEEGILWIKLQDKADNTALCMCVCYVPPEHSTRDVNMNDILDTLLVQVQQYQKEGLLIMCGDFNSRLGDRLDYILRR